MSSTPVPESQAFSGLNPSDRKFLEQVLTCLNTPIDLDVLKLAEKLGIKPKSVTNRWAEVRRKLYANVGTDNAGPSTPATPRKRKADDAGDEIATPKKTPKSSAKGGKRATKTPKGGKEGKAASPVETPTSPVSEDDTAVEDDGSI